MHATVQTDVGRASPGWSDAAPVYDAHSQGLTCTNEGEDTIDAEFSEQAWDSIAGWRDAVAVMPFVTKLADGSLPDDAFGFYLAQDAVYLTEFARVLSLVSAAASDPTAQAFYAGSAQIALEVETGLHRSWLIEHDRPLTAQASPVTAAYTNHLLASSVHGYPVAVAAVLPCYRLYAHIADIIVRAAGNLTDHPYRRWLTTYADTAFQESARLACQHADNAARTTDPATRTAMLTAFTRSTMHEYLFFEQGLDQPGWPDPPVRQPRPQHSD